MRAARAARYICSSGRSPEKPSEPCTWIARSITSCSTFAPQYLIIAISTRALDAPTWSIVHAACSVSSRAACISAALVATQSCTICFSASTEPCV